MPGLWMGRVRRVLHVVPSVAPVRGGPSAAVRAMVRGLARAGLDVEVATTDDAGPGRLAVPLGTPVDDDGVRYRYFSRQARGYTMSWPLFRWLGRNVGRYDVVHAHALFSHASTAAGYWAWRERVPYIVRPLGTLNRWGMRRRPLLKRLSFRLLECRLLSHAALVQYTSEPERLEAARLGVPHRTAVVPLGADLEPFQRLPPRGWLARRAPGLGRRTVVLFMARIDPVKGLDLLLAALATLRREPTSIALVVAGRGTPDCEAAARREAARHGVDGDIVWTGFLDEEAKLAALADADLFVLPSHSESFGMAAVEAMACGLPVVVSDQVGIHGDVAAAGAGHVVPCDAGALAHAIGLLARDPAARARLGERGRRLARDRFSMDAATAGLLEMYEQVTDRGHHSPAGER